MAVKKTKGKAKAAVKKSKKKASSKAKKPADFARVREDISNMVRVSARKIAKGVIEGAEKGQLASAKYMFEAVGLYPPTEQTETNPGEESMAQVLLRRMNLPLEPVIRDEDGEDGGADMVARKAQEPQRAGEQNTGEQPAALGGEKSNDEKTGGERCGDDNGKGPEPEETPETESN